MQEWTDDDWETSPDVPAGVLGAWRSIPSGHDVRGKAERVAAETELLRFHFVKAHPTPGLSNAHDDNCALKYSELGGVAVHVCTVGDVDAQRHHQHDDRDDVLPKPVVCSAVLPSSVESIGTFDSELRNDTTGLQVWPASVRLSQFLVSHMLSHLGSASAPPGVLSLVGSSVVELGSGLSGLPALTAAACGASRVLITDGNTSIIERLCASGHLPPSCCAVQLSWNSSVDQEEARAQFASDGFDWVLGSDVVYNTEAVDAFFDCARALQKETANLLLCYTRRSAAVDSQIEIASKRTGMELKFRCSVDGFTSLISHVDEQLFLSWYETRSSLR